MLMGVIFWNQNHLIFNLLTFSPSELIDPFAIVAWESLCKSIKSWRVSCSSLLRIVSASTATYKFFVNIINFLVPPSLLYCRLHIVYFHATMSTLHVLEVNDFWVFWCMDSMQHFTDHLYITILTSTCITQWTYMRDCFRACLKVLVWMCGDFIWPPLSCSFRADVTISILWVLLM